MDLTSWFYVQASKGFRNEPARKIKDLLRPVKHALVGKQGIYKALEMVNEIEKKAGKEVRVVFDVGAAIGEAALPMLRAFPHAEVYCFEPNSDSFRMLQRRTKKFAHRVHYFNFGIYDKNAELKFYLRDDHRDGSSFLNPPELRLQKNREVIVPTRTIDDVCRELGVKHIDFLKVDVEGVEKEVVVGARQMLPHIDNAFVEITPSLKEFNGDYIDVFREMHDAGFTFIGPVGDYLFSRIWRPSK